MRIPEWFTGGSIGRRNDREKVRQTFARLGVHVSSFPPCFARFVRSEPIHLQRRSRRLGAFRSWAARRSKETDIAGNIQLFALIRAVWESRRAISISGSVYACFRGFASENSALSLRAYSNFFFFFPFRARRLLEELPTKIFAIPNSFSFNVSLSCLVSSCSCWRSYVAHGGLEIEISWPTLKFKNNLFLPLILFSFTYFIVNLLLHLHLVTAPIA